MFPFKALVIAAKKIISQENKSWSVAISLIERPLEGQWSVHCAIALSVDLSNQIDKAILRGSVCTICFYATSAV